MTVDKTNSQKKKKYNDDTYKLNEDNQVVEEMKYLKGPVRPYFEVNILSYLNEALDLVDQKRPNNPLEFVGNFFIEKSKEIKEL